MTIPLTIKALVCLVGAATGLLLSLLILGIRREDPLPARLLAAFGLNLSTIAAAAFFLVGGGPDLGNRIIYPLMQPLVCALGPLLYLYVRAEIDPVRGFVPRQALHLLAPVVMGTLHAWWWWSMVLGRVELSFAVIAWIKNLLRFLSLGLFLGYTGLALAALVRHGNAVRKTYSFGGRISLSWMRGFLLAALAVPFLYLILYALNPPSELRLVSRLAPINDAGFLALVLGLVFFHAFIYLGLTQPGLILSERLREERSAEKYQSSPLGSRELQALEQKLDSLMRDKEVFLDSDLTLALLSERLAVAPRLVSQVINQTKGVNFFSYVNGFRIEAAKKRLAQADETKATVLEIALDSGFSSKSSFNAVFKEMTGLTPTAYRIQAVRRTGPHSCPTS